jgi:CheY-like chemotaxis protein
MTEKYKVLIVDDDRVLCMVFKEGLLDGGYDCETTLNGRAALGAAGEQGF